MVKIARDYFDEARAELPRGSDIQYSGSGVELRVACKHGHAEIVHLQKRFPADAIRRVLSNKGWQFHGNKATCPAHADNKVKGENVTQISEAMKAAQEGKVVPIASPPAKHAKRDALRWLDESFDTVAGRYKDGMTDQKIADEVGLSVKAVADLRAEFGYDLKTPPEIVQMQDVAETLKSDIETLAQEAATRFTGLLKRVADLEGRLARYEAKP